MAVIAQFRIPADSFELGRILEMEPGTAIELENMVPLGNTTIPYFSVSEEARTSFEANVRGHPSVHKVEEIARHNDEAVFP